MVDKVRVGVVGCGAISGAYFKNAKNLPILDMAACADIRPEAAEAKAKEYGIPKACTVEQIMADPSIDVILNLTVPKAHVAVNMQAILAGKHVYAEKPLGTNRDEAKAMLDEARKRKILVGCAPDTVLGAGIQTARKLIDDGAIGRPVAFTAFMLCPGHEGWHPSPEFYYQVGGGPMFDMGPYYLTALLNLLGPVKRISGIASIAIPERTIASQPKAGQKMIVETPDHISGLIEFQNGVSGAIMTSFATRFPTHDGKQPITIYGENGTLRIPDPNGFDGPVHIRLKGEQEYREVPHAFPKGYGRSVGLADMCYAIRTGRKFRCNGNQAFAVLDIMQAFLDSSEKGKALKPKAKYLRPAAMPADLPFGQLDE